MVNALWVDKYAPITSKEIIGNPGTINEMKTWLETWKHHFVHQKERGGKKSQQKSDFKKALLVCGKTGIGKTLAAHLISKELGYDIVELNALHSRGKATKDTKKGIEGKLSNKIKELVTNESIFKEQGKKNILIADEIDCISGEERGGITQMIDNIKVTKIPIICICNDKYENRKLYSLRNHCLELDFRRPTVDQILKKLKYICNKENMDIEDEELKEMIKASNNDIRFLINSLQGMRTSRQKSDEVDSSRINAISIQKDNIHKTPFEICKELLSGDTNESLDSLSNLVFKDVDLIPHFVFENYMNYYNDEDDEKTRLDKWANAADLLAKGAQLKEEIYKTQNWSLLPTYVTNGVVIPAQLTKGKRHTSGVPGERNMDRFPKVLGQMSRINAANRKLELLRKRIMEYTNQMHSLSMIRDLLPLIKVSIHKPLKEKGLKGVEEAVETCHEYGFQKAELDLLIELTQPLTNEGIKNDIVKGIPTNVKAALTRALNKKTLKPKSSIASQDMMIRNKQTKKSLNAILKNKADVENENENDIIVLGRETDAGKPKVEPEEEEEEDNLEDNIEDKISELKNSGIKLETKEKKKTSRKRKLSTTTNESSKKGKRGGGGGGGGGGSGSGSGGRARGRGRGRRGKTDN